MRVSIIPPPAPFTAPNIPLIASKGAVRVAPILFKEENTFPILRKILDMNPPSPAPVLNISMTPSIMSPIIEPVVVFTLNHLNGAAILSKAPPVKAFRVSIVVSAILPIL